MGMKKCERCEKNVDITSTDANTVLTIRYDYSSPKLTRKPQKRAYLCDLCTIELEDFLRGWFVERQE